VLGETKQPKDPWHTSTQHCVRMLGSTAQDPGYF